MRYVISILASGLSLTPPLFQLLPRRQAPAPLQCSFSILSEVASGSVAFLGNWLARLCGGGSFLSRQMSSKCSRLSSRRGGAAGAQPWPWHFHYLFEEP